MPARETKKALIVVKTYPTPAKKGAEVSCTAAITDNGEWLRLFPVPWRYLSAGEQFSKYQWVEVEVEKASDPRPESYKLTQSGIKILSEPLTTDNEWRVRRDFVEPLRSHCLWEMAEAWRDWKAKYGDQWEAKFRQRFEKEMIEKLDTHFFVGTVKAHPEEWIIVGLFYPPYVVQPRLGFS
jgi:hypothetical protein